MTPGKKNYTLSPSLENAIEDTGLRTDYFLKKAIIVYLKLLEFDRDGYKVLVSKDDKTSELTNLR